MLRILKSIFVSLMAATFMVTACEKPAPVDSNDNSGPGSTGSDTQTPGDSGELFDDVPTTPWPAPYSLKGLTVDNQFPIIGWTGIEPADATTKFPKMKECGVNVYLHHDYESAQVALTQLNIAQQSGIKIICRTKDIFSNTQTVVNQLKSHPALFGYHIEDEPETNELAGLSRYVDNIEAADANHFCYINVYPNWAWCASNIDDYMSRLTTYTETVKKLKFISFDHYPVYEDNTGLHLRAYWYKNLEDIRRMARIKKLPFWAFANTLAHEISDPHLGTARYPQPTLADLRLQQFSNLAYGAQAFQYFTVHGFYRTSTTQAYASVKSVNADLQVLAKFFLGADVTNVWHMGSTVPYGTTKLSTMPEGVKSIDLQGTEGAVVSVFEKDWHRYICIVNKDLKSPRELNIIFKNFVYKFNKKGFKTKLKSDSFMLDPGDIIVYQLK